MFGLNTWTIWWFWIQVFVSPDLKEGLKEFFENLLHYPSQTRTNLWDSNTWPYDQIQTNVNWHFHGSTQYPRRIETYNRPYTFTDLQENKNCTKINLGVLYFSDIKESSSFSECLKHQSVFVPALSLLRCQLRLVFHTRDSGRNSQEVWMHPAMWSPLWIPFVENTLLGKNKNPFCGPYHRSPTNQNHPQVRRFSEKDLRLLWIKFWWYGWFGYWISMIRLIFINYLPLSPSLSLSLSLSMPLRMSINNFNQNKLAIQEPKNFFNKPPYELETKFPKWSYHHILHSRPSLDHNH